VGQQRKPYKQWGKAHDRPGATAPALTSAFGHERQPGLRESSRRICHFSHSSTPGNESTYIKGIDMKKSVSLLVFFPVVILVLLVVLSFVLPKQEYKSDTASSLAQLIPPLMEEAAIPGLAIAKISNGRTSTLQTYGRASIDRGRLVDEDTLFNIASISKPVMGLVLLQLVDQGLLELDRDINEYLPFTINNPHAENEEITIRHLASHSSGIDDYYDINSYAINRDSSVSLEQHLRSLLTPDGTHYDNGQYYLNQMPGEGRKYSNLAAGLAGYLVEAQTGLTLAEYSQTHLFKSLGMTNTSWLLHDLDMDKVAVPYEVEQCIPYLPICADTESPKLNFLISEYFDPPFAFKHFEPYPHFGNPQYPDGGVRSSIKDLSVFLESLLNNRDKTGNALLSKELYEEMFKLQLDKEVSDSQRFFWRDNAMGLTGHMGSDLGVFTSLYFDPETKTGFIILMNRGMDNKAASAMKKIAMKLMESE
jgi:CubicO group peptidase (beta-lactamase class C family)